MEIHNLDLPGGTYREISSRALPPLLHQNSDCLDCSPALDHGGVAAVDAPPKAGSGVVFLEVGSEASAAGVTPACPAATLYLDQQSLLRQREVSAPVLQASLGQTITQALTRPSTSFSSEPVLSDGFDAFRAKVKG